MQFSLVGVLINIVSVSFSCHKNL